MKKNLNHIGIAILLALFILFYIVTTITLDKRNINKTEVKNEEPIKDENTNYESKNIINNLYKEARIIYDVVNNKFKVDQEDTITIGDIIYKKITNFEEIMEWAHTQIEHGKIVSIAYSHSSGVYSAVSYRRDE